MMWPKWFELAKKELGVKEGPGGSDNPHVLQYYRDAGHPEVKHDETAWCAAFVGAMLERAGVPSSHSLAARSYVTWGVKLTVPVQGCVVVLRRNSNPTQGHVAFFDHNKPGALGTGRVVLLGGNQSDQVCYESFPVNRVIAYRWPDEGKVSHPA